MTKKEVAVELRKIVNSFIRSLPDKNYKCVQSATDGFAPGLDGGSGGMEYIRTAELGVVEESEVAK